MSREKDIQKICEGILETESDWYDNPVGKYESSCPFCCAIEYRGGRDAPIFVNINDLKHDQDCIYLIAKDLMTNIEYHTIDDKYLEKADMWYNLHVDHITNLIKNIKTGYPPTLTEDIINPWLWKPEHWRWFINNKTK